nr:hypothetical protein [uncultured Novosphingobium sp.]
MQPDPSHPLEPAPITLCALLLGRIQIGISRASDAALPVLAARSIRESLLTALRQEGHEFTESRFFTWFAGLDTLSEGSPASLRPPKALCQAILTEFRHNPWPPLALAAEALLRAFIAPSDVHLGTEHEDAHTAVQAAHALIAAIDSPEDALPFHAAARLFAAAARSPHFARQMPSLALVRGMAMEQRPTGHAGWALDILAGRYLSPRHGLPAALPLPGLVVLPAGLPDSDDPDVAQEAIAALHGAFSRIDRWLTEAERDGARISAGLHDRRSSGRARELAGYLAGFGPLRGVQIEALIGVSRPGVRVLTTTLSEAGLVETHVSRNAARVHAYLPWEPEAPAPPPAQEKFTPSREAIGDYEASMRAIEDLLNRTAARDDDD